MKFYFDKRVLIGFSITMLVLVIFGFFSYSSTQRLMDSAGLEAHATRVINTADLIVKAMIDMETGQRGFLITNDEEFLEPFHESSKVVTPYLNTLDSLTIENIGQQTKIDSLRRIINSQIEWTKNVVEVRKINFEQAQALVVMGEGKRNMDKIRNIILEIQEEERSLFNTRNTITTQSVQQFQYSFVGLVVVMIIIIFYLFYAINTTLKSRNEAEGQLVRVARDTKDLYDHAPCGFLSVDHNIFLSNINKTLLDWLGYTEQEVIGKLKFEDLLMPESKKAFLKSFEEDFEQYKKSGVINDLEFDFQRKDGTTFPVLVNSVAIFNDRGEFVKSRSTVSDNSERKKAQDRILDLNKELEGFTYSVSHDLRAPLRSIVGYTNILKDEYYDKMDDEAKRITDVIIRNTTRMGQLIDDLLDFSRLGRKPVAFSNINMKETVETIFREQIAEQKDRKFTINVMDMEPVKGDLAMIRQVWINLISNAVKYTSKKDVSEIEVGFFKQDGMKVYYIRDNGAGFDMKYVDKLFGVFQRLHKMNEFEGTGVGLALVKTIIKRHGGDVWAEAKINEGAKFYFSLK